MNQSDALNWGLRKIDEAMAEMYKESTSDDKCEECNGTGTALPCHDCKKPTGKRSLNKCHDDGTLRCDTCQDKHMEPPDVCDLCYKAFHTDPDAVYDAKGIDD